MRGFSSILCLLGASLLSGLNQSSLAQEAPGQAPQAAIDAVGSEPGQAAVSGMPEGGAPGGPGGISTTLTFRSYPIGPGASAGNLEGAACSASSKMLSGACHPFYNDHVTIINQFPDIPANTWRCGFKNNTAATVTVWIYTLCAQ
jgi:hypothetical protein